MLTTLELLKKLIACKSVTPDDAGCQKIIADILQTSGFMIEVMPFDEVTNLWARHGKQHPLVVFAGHTDVVPPGPLDAWTSDPFTPTERNGKLYGRGAADMKSGLAAMVVAATRFIADHPAYTGSIGFLITSDEEGPGINGTKAVMKTLTARDEKIDFCIVGEAGCDIALGDKIRIGRRGSLHGDLTVHGVQGHIAYPEKIRNPIHAAVPALAELATEKWDEGNEYFPATTFQISNIHSGTGATNVVPGVLKLACNFRYSTAVTVDVLQQRVSEILNKHGLEYDMLWDCSAEPFLSSHGKLIQATQQAIHEKTDLNVSLSTEGGTSDARFIAPTGAEVIELGPINASIHQVDEHVNISDLETLTEIYQRMLELLLV